MRKWAIWTTVLLIYLGIPFLLWIQVIPLADRFSDWNISMKSMGQLGGLFGISLFAFNFILSARLKIVDRLLNGMNIAYLNHHTVGGAAFILLLAHPVFLAVQYLPQSLLDAAKLFIPDFDRLDILSGIVGLIVMMVLLLLTFYWMPKYRIWKFSHKFLALAFTFGFVHMLLIPSDTTQSPVLKGFIILVSAVAFGCILYRVLFPRILVQKFKYKIDKITELNSVTTSIDLKPAGEAMKYEAGQFVFLRIPGHKLGAEEHPFSIASKASSDGSIKIVVKKLGEYTSAMGRLSKGDEVYVEGPYGKFIPNSNDAKQIWIAGGIGITPFLGNLAGIKNQVKLFYSVKDVSEAVYLNDLESSRKNNANFSFFLWESNKKGHISSEKILEQEKGIDLKKTEIYICGPAAMMNSLKQGFSTRGSSKEDIHMENFSL